jgi:hypothetical protein
MHYKKCLLIIPKHFYSFQKHFKSELENRGYSVTVANDEYPENIWGLLMGKLKIPLTKLITYKQIKHYFLNDQYYDLIIIFKGRGLSTKLIDELKLHAAKVIGYNWDSFKFNAAPLSWYKKLTAYYTFDHKDSEEYSIPLVELFSSDNNLNVNEKKIDYKYSAIFRNHSNRLKYMESVIKYFDIQQDEIVIYIFEKNIFFALINFLCSPVLYLKYKKFIHFGFLDYENYSKIIKNSCYTIDYAHPKQTGLTMRCFEALNAKTNIITNNGYIRKSSYFQNLNPLIFNYNNPPLKGELQLKNENNFTVEWPKRTIVNFFNDLLK